ncbi:MAG: hypothetical protein WKG07_12415 [Hymenobacter sp.]
MTRARSPVLVRVTARDVAALRPQLEARGFADGSRPGRSCTSLRAGCR